MLVKTKKLRFSLKKLRKFTRQIFHDCRTKVVIFIFVAIIFSGSLILSLPVSVCDGRSTSFIDSLFTATSAVCVTGLSVVDTASHWSTFGQVVILILVQVGGLGFMSIATIFFLFIKKTISLNQRVLIQESLSYDMMRGIVGFVKKVVVISLVTELLGVFFLSLRFVPEYGWSNGIYKSIFHSVSAFCNAGFDVLGSKVGPSLCTYRDDWLVCGTVMVLTVCGGLGFMVWGDLLKLHGYKKWRLHTKIVVITSFLLISFGALFFYIFEYSNSETIGGLTWYQKVLPALFQSVTLRTSGFFTIEQGSITDASFILSTLFMFIGGSPGSTAGGVKTTTLCIIVLAIFKTINGSVDLNVFGRKIQINDIVRAFVVAAIACFIVVFGVIAMTLSEGVGLRTALFEVVSAFGTVGVSTGVTPHLSVYGKSILIFLMFVGRVGVFTFALSLFAGSGHRKKESVKYPFEHIIIG